MPPELTPAALPKGLSPDLVVTIQPGEMVFTTPAALTLPNSEGWAPGMKMDLWSINPISGEFEIVGKGQVSEDGQTVATVEGGIRNSSWHFFANPPLDWFLRMLDTGCTECEAGIGNTAGDEFSSDVSLYTGGLTETHELATYQSVGQTRGVQLVYDSLRADARPIFEIGFGEVNPSLIAPGFEDKLRLTAELKIFVNGVERQVPGYRGTESPSGVGKNFWKVPTSKGPVNAGLQADLRDVASGVYSFDMNAGIQLAVPRTVTTIVKEKDGSSSSSVSSVQSFVGTTSKPTGTEGSNRLLHVNTVDSAFGSGWGIAGVQELKEGYDGSILLIDGDGTELLFDAPATPDGGYVAPVGDFSTLKRLADGTFRRVNKNQTVYSFDENNRLISVVDRNGNATRHVYNDAGRLTKIVDPAGLETTFSYNSQGKVSQIVDPASRVTELVYDRAGNLLSIKDPDAAQRTFDYDKKHHMTGEIDQRGNRETAHYDEFGRATYADRKDGSKVTLQAVQTRNLLSPEKTASLLNAPYAFTNGEPVATYVDGNGNVTRTELDGAGQLVDSTINGRARVTRNSNNLVSTATNDRGHVTLFTYDDNGNVLTVQDELSNGSSVLGSINQPGEKDIFTFTGTAGQRLYFDSLGVGSSDIRVQLLDPRGYGVFSTDSATDSEPFFLSSSGEYQLIFDGNGDATGDYRFQLTDLAETPRLAFDKPISNTSKANAKSDFYQFTGVAGQRLFFDSLSAEPGVNWSVYDPNNRTLVAQSSAADIDLLLPEDGLYILELESADRESGLSYRFQATNLPNTTPGNTGLTLDTEITGSIAGAREVYSFRGAAGQRLYFDGLSNNSTVYAKLLGPNGSRLFNVSSRDDSGLITLSETGTYQLVLEGQGSTAAAYRFRMAEVSAAPTVEIGTTVSGTLEPGNASKLFQFTATAGQKLLFDSLSNYNYRNQWTIYSSDNQYVAGNYFSYDRDLSIARSDTYMLVLSGGEINSTVDYSFQIIDAELVTTNLKLNLDTIVTSSIAQAGAREVYSFSGTAGQRLYFDGLSSDSSIYAELLGPTGSSLFNRHYRQ